MHVERSLKYVFHVLSRPPKGQANSARIHIPETLFYEHGTLQFWYRYDPDTNEIVRKDRRECSQELIYEALGLEGKGVDASLRASAVSTMLAGGFNVNFPDVPVAVVLSGRLIVPGFVPGDPRKEPENHRLRRDARRRARAGQSAIRKINIPLELMEDDDDASSVDSDDSRGGVSQPKMVIAESFLDRAGVDTFLNGNELKHHSLLQKYPLGRSLHATVVEAVYSPQVTYITQRQNKRFLSDTAVSLYERCCTAESTPHLVDQIQISPKAKALVDEACSQIVDHIMAVDRRCVARMVAYFSFEQSEVNPLFGEETGGIKPLLLWVPELHLSREVSREDIRKTLTTFVDRRLLTLQPETVPGMAFGPGQRKKRQDYLQEREKYLPMAAKVGSPSVMAMNGRGGTDRLLSSVTDKQYSHLCESLAAFRTSEQRQRSHNGSSSSITSSSSHQQKSSSSKAQQNASGGAVVQWAGSPFEHLLRDANPNSVESSEDKIRRIVAASNMTSGQSSQLILNKSSSSSSNASPASHYKRTNTPGAGGSSNTNKNRVSLSPLPHSHAAFSSPSSMLSPSRAARLMKQKQQQQSKKMYDTQTGMLIEIGSPTKKQQQQQQQHDDDDEGGASAAAPQEGTFPDDNDSTNRRPSVIANQVRAAEHSLLQFETVSSGSESEESSSPKQPRMRLHSVDSENDVTPRKSALTRPASASGAPHDNSDTSGRRQSFHRMSNLERKELKRRDSQSAELQAALLAARAQAADRNEKTSAARARAGVSNRRGSRYDNDDLPIDADMFSTLSGVRLHAKSKQLINSAHSPGWLRCLSPDVNIYLHKELSALDAAVEWLTHMSYTFENAARRAEERQREAHIGPGGGTGDGRKMPDVPVSIEISPFPPPSSVRKCPLTVADIQIGPPKIYLFACWRMILFPGPASERTVMRSPSPFGFGGNRRPGIGGARSPSKRRGTTTTTSFSGGVLGAMMDQTGGLFGGAGAAHAAGISPGGSGRGAATTTSNTPSLVDNSSFAEFSPAAAAAAAAKSKRRRKSIITQALLQEESYVVPYAVESNSILGHLGSAIGKENQSVSVNIDSWTLTGVEDSVRTQSRLLDTPVMSLGAAQMLGTPYITQKFAVFTPRSNNYVVPTPQGGATVVTCDSIRDCRQRAEGMRQLARIAATTKRFILFETIGIALRKAATFSRKMHLNAITADAQLAGGAGPLDGGGKQKRSSAFMAAAVRLFREDHTVISKEQQLEKEEAADARRRKKQQQQQQQLEESRTSSMSPSTSTTSLAEQDNESNDPGQQHRQQPVSVHTDPGRVIRRFFSEVPCALSAPATWGAELIDLQLRFSGAGQTVDGPVTDQSQLSATTNSDDPQQQQQKKRSGEVFIPASPHEVAPIARQLQAACEKFTGDLKKEVIRMLRVACMPNYLADIPPDVSEELLLLDATSNMKRPTTRSRLTPDQQQQMFVAAMKAIRAEGDTVTTRRQNPALEPVNAAVEDWPPRLVIRSEAIPEGLC